MLYLTCTTITSEDLAHYGVSRAKDSVSVDCGTSVSEVVWIFTSCLHFDNIDVIFLGWSGGAMVLGKLPVVGRPTL